MALPIASTPKLGVKATKQFLMKVEKGIKTPTRPIPTPKIDAAIEMIMKDAKRSGVLEMVSEGSDMIEQLEEQRKILMQKLVKIDAAIETLRMEAIKKEWGVSIGCIVKAIRTGKQHRVTRIDTNWGKSKPWLGGNPMRKDGTFGTANYNLYGSWEI